MSRSVLTTVATREAIEGCEIIFYVPGSSCLNPNGFSLSGCIRKERERFVERSLREIRCSFGGSSHRRRELG
jgi:hypothetical protein